MSEALLKAILRLFAVVAKEGEVTRQERDQIRVFLDDHLSQNVRETLLAQLTMLEEFGPLLGRPHVDTIKNSKHPNMKELRVAADSGVWRFAFAFDPLRQAIVLCGGDKAGVAERVFYRQLIAKADARFDQHLARIRQIKRHRGR